VRLREDMSRIVLELREISILAARSPEDAEAMAGVLQMAAAMDKIADAAEDIARVVLKDLGVPPELRDDLRHAEEVVTAVLFRDKGLAAEVGAIEDSTDEMHHELERWVLRAVTEGGEPDSLRGLLHLAFANERIADAAQEMTKLVEYEDEPHPIISEALAEADEIVVQESVAPTSEAAGKSLRDLRLRTEIGMEVLAIQRGGRWIYRPRS